MIIKISKKEAKVEKNVQYNDKILKLVLIMMILL